MHFNSRLVYAGLWPTLRRFSVDFYKLHVLGIHFLTGVELVHLLAKSEQFLSGYWVSNTVVLATVSY